MEPQAERDSRPEKWSMNKVGKNTTEGRGGGGLRQYVEPLAEHDPQPEKWSITKSRKAATSLDDENSWEEISDDVRLLQKHFKERKEGLEKRKAQASKHVAVDGDGKSHAPDVGAKGQSEPVKNLPKLIDATSEKNGESAKGNDKEEIPSASDKVQQQDHGKLNRPHSAKRSKDTISKDSSEVDEDLLSMISVLPQQDRERILALFNERHKQDRNEPDRPFRSERSEKATSEDPSEDPSKAAKCEIGLGGIQFTSNAKPHAHKPFPSECSFKFGNATPRDPSEVDDLNAAIKDIPKPSSEMHQQDQESDILYSATRTFRFGNLTSEEPSEAADGTSSMTRVPRAPRERRQKDHGRSDQFHPAARVHYFGDAFSKDSGNAVDGKTSAFNTPRISSKAQQHDYGKPERPTTVNRVSDLAGSTDAELRKAGSGKASMGEILHGLRTKRQQNHSKSNQPHPAEPLSDSGKIEPRPWTQDEVDLLHELRHQDVKNTKIAERLGRSLEDTMRKWFDVKNDESEGFILTAEQMELIRTQRAVGFTWANIKKVHFPNAGVKTLKKAAVKAAGGREIPRWPDEGSVERRRLEREHPVRMTHEEAVGIREKREQKIGWSTIMRYYRGEGTDVPEFVFRRAYNKRIAAYDKTQRKERLKEQKEARKVRVKQKLEVRRAKKAEMRAE